MATGLAMIDVEPFPRLKLMKLYYMTLEEIKDIPDIFRYKVLASENTKYRMKVVDELENVRAIEEKIGYGMVEDLIKAAHNELRMLKWMKENEPWLEDHNQDEGSIEEEHTNFNLDFENNPFDEPTESYQKDKHVKPDRPKTSGIH